MFRPSKLIPLALAISCSLLPAAFAKEIAPGDRVLVKGFFDRKCSARVAEFIDSSHARLEFDQSGCGEQTKLYSKNSIQRLVFVEGENAGLSGFRMGSSVWVEGYFGAKCVGKVKEVSRSGYVSVALDAPLCADASKLRKISDLHKLSFVEEAQYNKNVFRVGQQVTVPGIYQQDKCKGKISQIAENGWAVVAFEELTCASRGKLYSLEQLSPFRAPASTSRRERSEAIFRRVMKEIASTRSAK